MQKKLSIKQALALVMAQRELDLAEQHVAFARERHTLLLASLGVPPSCTFTISPDGLLSWLEETK